MDAMTAHAADDWSAVAAAWDAEIEEVDVHSAPATEALLTSVAIRTGERVLELASGPGSLGELLIELGERGKRRQRVAVAHG